MEDTLTVRTGSIVAVRGRGFKEEERVDTAIFIKRKTMKPDDRVQVTESLQNRQF